MDYAIIAAGEGSRLRACGGTPKPLVDIDGRPMLRRLLDIFGHAGAESVSIAVNAALPSIGRYIDAIAPDLPFALRTIAVNTAGSMESLAALAPLLPPGRRFILATADTVFSPDDFAAYARDFAAAPDGTCLMAVTEHIDDERPLYVATDKQMRITGFHDAPCPGDRYISGGIYGLPPQALDILDESISLGATRMRQFQRALVGAGLDVRAYPFGKIIDVDRPSDLAAARSLAASQKSE